MTSKQEMTVTIMLFLFILTLIDVGVMKYALSHIEMNGSVFISAGMMEYTNPKDHKELYIPIYIKR